MSLQPLYLALTVKHAPSMDNTASSACISASRRPSACFSVKGILDAEVVICGAPLLGGYLIGNYFRKIRQWDWTAGLIISFPSFVTSLMYDHKHEIKHHVAA